MSAVESNERIFTEGDFEARVQMRSGRRRSDAISLSHNGLLVARMTRRTVEKLRDLLDLALQVRP